MGQRETGERRERCMERNYWREIDREKIWERTRDR